MLLKLMLDMQTEERNALAAIAQYAEEMKNANVAEKSAETAKNCLQQAVVALSKITTVLENCQHLWEMMALACQRLTGSNLTRIIKNAKGEKVEQRIAEYMDSEFKQKLLQLAARWYALQLVAKELRTGILGARQEHQQSINKVPTIEEAGRLARALGAKLKLDVDAEIKRLDGTIALLTSAVSNASPGGTTPSGTTAPPGPTAPIGARA